MTTVANNSNLVPFNTMSKERHREISRLGGVASGEARRQKRDLKELVMREDRVQDELARIACSILLEASNLLVESSHYSNTLWALEYSPSAHKFRISKTYVAAQRNLKQLSEGHKLDYILIAVAATKQEFDRITSAE